MSLGTQGCVHMLKTINLYEKQVYQFKRIPLLVFIYYWSLKCYFDSEFVMDFLLYK